MRCAHKIDISFEFEITIVYGTTSSIQNIFCAAWDLGAYFPISHFSFRTISILSVKDEIGDGLNCAKR